MQTSPRITPMQKNFKSRQTQPDFCGHFVDKFHQNGFLRHEATQITTREKRWE
jgi:hypothetical protein